MFDDRESNIIRERRNLIDQRSQFPHKRQRQKVGARAHRLADLDKCRPEFYEFFFEPDRLFFLVCIFAGSVADKKPAHEPHEQIKKPKSNGVQFFAVNRCSRQFTRAFHASGGPL